MAMETLEEAVKAGVGVAVNYDGAKIVQTLYKYWHDHELTMDQAQDIWDEINGKNTP